MRRAASAARWDGVTRAGGPSGLRNAPQPRCVCASARIRQCRRTVSCQAAGGAAAFVPLPSGSVTRPAATARLLRYGRVECHHASRASGAAQHTEVARVSLPPRRQQKLRSSRRPQRIYMPARVAMRCFKYRTAAVLRVTAASRQRKRRKAAAQERCHAYESAMPTQRGR